jgi:uncharacterized membrane protein YphA (DoxX/SURF4 family)
MNVLESNAFGSSLLLTMFFISGLHKVFTLDKTIDNLQSKLNIQKNLATLGIYIVILLEIIAPILIIYNIITTKYTNYAKYSVWSLIIFTIVVTFIYHYPDFSNYYKSLAFLSNISLIGGLLVLQKTL